MGPVFRRAPPVAVRSPAEPDAAARASYYFHPAAIRPGCSSRRTLACLARGRWEAYSDCARRWPFELRKAYQASGQREVSHSNGMPRPNRSPSEIADRSAQPGNNPVLPLRGAPPLKRRDITPECSRNHWVAWYLRYAGILSVCRGLILFGSLNTSRLASKIFIYSPTFIRRHCDTAPLLILERLSPACTVYVRSWRQMGRGHRRGGGARAA